MRVIRVSGLAAKNFCEPKIFRAKKKLPASHACAPCACMEVGSFARVARYWADVRQALWCNVRAIARAGHVI